MWNRIKSFFGVGSPQNEDTNHHVGLPPGHQVSNNNPYLSASYPNNWAPVPSPVYYTPPPLPPPLPLLPHQLFHINQAPSAHPYGQPPVHPVLDFPGVPAIPNAPRGLDQVANQAPHPPTIPVIAHTREERDQNEAPNSLLWPDGNVTHTWPEGEVPPGWTLSHFAWNSTGGRAKGFPPTARSIDVRKCLGVLECGCAYDGAPAAIRPKTQKGAILRQLEDSCPTCHHQYRWINGCPATLTTHMYTGEDGVRQYVR